MRYATTYSYRAGIWRNLPRFLALAMTLLTLASCVSPGPVPLQEMGAAESAISRAEQADVASLAAPELNTAREKLAFAHAAVEQEDMIKAVRLAEESRVIAELAFAKAEMLKARKINEDIQANIDTLKQEMLRNNEANQ